MPIYRVKTFFLQILCFKQYLEHLLFLSWKFTTSFVIHNILWNLCESESLSLTKLMQTESNWLFVHYPFVNVSVFVYINLLEIHKNSEFHHFWQDHRNIARDCQTIGKFSKACDLNDAICRHVWSTMIYKWT